MKTAVISPCGRYRYRLTRGKGNLMPVVMLNPSTADAYQDDPTIRSLMRLAGANRFNGIDVVNLFGFRATSPYELKSVGDPYGPENEDHQIEFCTQSGRNIVVAWGNHATEESVQRFMGVIDRCMEFSCKQLLCFGQNKNGSPKHPLYLKSDTQLGLYFHEN